MRGSLILGALFLTSSLSAFAGGCENYCVGIRGNGEAAPAHWAALSRMVEENGMPKATAGGSSATVTMFFLDAMAGNSKLAAEQDAEKKRKMQALMLKSMPEFMAVFAKQSGVADGFNMMQAYGGGDPEAKKKAIEAFGNAGSLSKEQLQAAMGKYGTLLNPELLALVKKDPARFGPEAVKSIKNLGAFNAVTDDTLFFRPGLVDFKGFSVVLGQIADFYAGNTDPAIKAQLEGFMEECSEKAYQKEWQSVDSDCKGKFQKIASDYLSGGKFQHKALFDKVGTHTNAMPTTSVIQGEGMQKYLRMKKAYESGTAQNIGDFSLDFKNDIAFGYFGRPEDLARAKQGLEAPASAGDLRAKKFRDMGQASWFDVLATSPAEPGIANAQRIPQGNTREEVLTELQKPIDQRWKGLKYRKDALSAGGWNDLQPTGVLKAQGCQPIVFLTRQSPCGDSKFGQQVLIRLSGNKKEIPFWDKICDAGPGGWCQDKIRAAGGDPAKIADTAWHQLVNLCNPDSSFRRALDASDASYCTRWDATENDVFRGKMRDLVKDAYNAPSVPNSSAGAACRLNQQPRTTDSRALPSCLPFKGEGVRDEGGGAGGNEETRPAQ
jgi:hypothetical protein